MSHQAISEAIAETNSQEKHNRLLPTHLIVALLIALSLWSKDSVGDRTLAKIFCGMIRDYLFSTFGS